MTIAINQLILAPMEGVMDYLMRDLITQRNDFDLCITEFVRVVDSLVPKHVMFRLAPELHNLGRTHAGTKIRVQLLGQDPNWMAENAIRAIALGSHGIDINFGCPAKAVNKNKGGAVLLKTPELIYQIVAKVRQALPCHQPVSVKIRLGFDDDSKLAEIVDAIVQAKASALTIHARTKVQGYRPPAHWHMIANIANNINIPVIANGEIWSLLDAQNCMAQAKTRHLMLGRGILALPNLGNVVKYHHAPFSWLELSELLVQYCALELDSSKGFYFSSRLKQWLRYLKLQYPQAEHLFQQIKTMSEHSSIMAIIQRSMHHS
jgi:tRNA-dihydrouridine synthase C